MLAKFNIGADDPDGWEHKIPSLTIMVSSSLHNTMFTPARAKGESPGS